MNDYSKLLEVAASKLIDAGFPLRTAYHDSFAAFMELETQLDQRAAFDLLRSHGFESLSTVGTAIQIGGRSADAILEDILELAPSESAARFRDLLRFLRGTLPPQVCVVRPWADRHWTALRRQLPFHEIEKNAWMILLLEEIHTAQHDTDVDAESTGRIAAIRRALPDQNELNRLRDQVLLDLENVPDADREHFLSGTGWEHLVTVTEKPRRQAWLTRKEIKERSRKGSDRDGHGTRREDGSGPRTAFDSAAERLMMFLMAESDPDPNRARVPLNTAARLTSDLLLWCVGGDRRPHGAIASWWDRQRRDPRRAPAQP